MFIMPDPTLPAEQQMEIVTGGKMAKSPNMSPTGKDGAPIEIALPSGLGSPNM